MSSRRRAGPDIAKSRAGESAVKHLNISFKMASPVVKALYTRFLAEVEWPPGSPDSIHKVLAHVLAQVLAPLLVRTPEETLAACPVNKVSTAGTPGVVEVCPELVGKGLLVPRPTSIVSCQQGPSVDERFQFLQNEVNVLRAHMRDATGVIAVWQTNAKGQPKECSAEQQVQPVGCVLQSSSSSGAGNDIQQTEHQKIVEQIRGAQQMALARVRSESISSVSSHGSVAHVIDNAQQHAARIRGHGPHRGRRVQTP